MAQIGWRSYWRDRLCDAWHQAVSYAGEQAPWDLAVIPAVGVIAIVVSLFLPGENWLKALLGLLIAIGGLFGAIVLLFIWNVLWAPINHARRLERVRQERETWEELAQLEFEHFFKYGNIVKDMLQMKIIQTDMLQQTNWRQLAVNWRKLLGEAATKYLTAFEAQRLSSNAGLTLQGIPGAPQEVDRYHRDLDGRLQRLENLIDHQAWKRGDASDGAE
jgi:hypothetical protein